MTPSELPAPLQAALDRMTPLLRKAFLDAVSQVRSTAQLQAIIGHLENGDVESAVKVLGLDPILFAPLDQAIQQAFWQGGVVALASLPPLPPDPFSGSPVRIGFNARASTAENWVRQHSSKLITNLVDGQREMARALLRAGLEAGTHPRTVALDLVGRLDRSTKTRVGGFIGLTDQFRKYAETAEAELKSGDPALLAHYLTRSRRNKTYDKMVERAIASGKPLKAEDIKSMVLWYRESLLKLRAETIARTEGLTALGAGQHEGFRQLVASGAVRDDQITRVWQSTGDRRTRHDHMIMNGQTRTGIDIPFDAPNGAKLLFPRDTTFEGQDPRLTAPETINCRCIEKIKVDYISRARGLPKGL